MLKMNVSYITSSKHTNRETGTETNIGISIRLLYSEIVAIAFIKYENETTSRKMMHSMDILHLWMLVTYLLNINFITCRAHAPTHTHTNTPGLKSPVVANLSDIANYV